MKRPERDPDTKSFYDTLSSEDFDIVEELAPSSNYARSFKAVKRDAVYCIKTVDTRPGRSLGSQDALIKMSKEIASVSFAFDKIPPAENLDDNRKAELSRRIASIHENGMWISPSLRLTIPWYAQRWIEGEELMTFWPKFVRDLHGQKFFDMFLRAARSLLEIVGYIHDFQVAHGDIWQKNIKVLDPGEDFRLALIDFAECFFPGQYAGTGTSARGSGGGASNTVYAPEERMGRKVSFQTDIYHIGETLLFLASKGNYRPSGPQPDATDLLERNFETAASELAQLVRTDPPKSKILEILKKHEGALDRSTTARSQRDELKTVVEDAVDDSIKSLVPGIIDVILLCKVGDLNLRASSVFEVRNLLETYARANRKTPLTAVQDSAQRITRLVEQHCNDADASRGRRFLTQMLSLELERVRWRIQSAVRTNIYEITGLRGDCIQGLLDFLSLLDPGDAYIAATIPSLWTSRGLGNEGRFYRLNMEMALNGIAIKRVFVVEKGTLGRFAANYPKLHESQCKLVRLLRKKKLYSRTGSAFDNAKCFIGVAEVDRMRLEQWDTAGFNVGLARFKIQDSWDDVQLYIRPTNEYLRRLDLKHVESAKVLLDMSELFSRAYSIDDAHHLGT